MDVQQYKIYVVRPTLKAIQLWTLASEELVLGTAVHESGGLQYIHQIHGPALGFVQMEPNTHDDIWINYLQYKTDLSSRIKSLGCTNPDARTLVYNLSYAVAMCRIHYLRKKEPLPKRGGIYAQARYWKKFYNTRLGAGTVDQYVKSWERYV